jgi:hypothetical protein
MVFIP